MTWRDSYWIPTWDGVRLVFYWATFGGLYWPMWELRGRVGGEPDWLYLLAFVPVVGTWAVAKLVTAMFGESDLGRGSGFGNHDDPGGTP